METYIPLVLSAREGSLATPEHGFFEHDHWSKNLTLAGSKSYQPSSTTVHKNYV